jgi:hypothetical protein
MRLTRRAFRGVGSCASVRTAQHFYHIDLRVAFSLGT